MDVCLSQEFLAGPLIVGREVKNGKSNLVFMQMILFLFSFLTKGTNDGTTSLCLRLNIASFIPEIICSSINVPYALFWVRHNRIGIAISVGMQK